MGRSECHTAAMQEARANRWTFNKPLLESKSPYNTTLLSGVSEPELGDAYFDIWDEPKQVSSKLLDMHRNKRPPATAALKTAHT